MCLLMGGMYNPIIPVFKRPPSEWRTEVFDKFKGTSIAKGYIRFFEPDVYVETQKELLEDAGLGALRKDSSIHDQVINIRELFKPSDGRDWAEPKFGLSVHETLRYIYRTEQRFVLRDEVKSVLVLPNRVGALAEAVFGVFPDTPSVKHIREAYEDVYRPEVISASPDAWRRVFLDGAISPLKATRFNLHTQRFWHHDPVIFVFDPNRTTDIIDLWNLRLEPNPLLPVPISWVDDLSEDILQVIESQHRPVVGNPHGMMHNATVEFGRSISKNEAERMTEKFGPKLPKGAFSVKYWRNPVWIENRDDRTLRDTRMRVTADEQRTDLVFKSENDVTAEFEPLSPKFAPHYGLGNYRWANVIRVSKFGPNSIAKNLPFNTYDRDWPILGLGREPIPITSEGWVFFKLTKTYLSQSILCVLIKRSLVY